MNMKTTISAAALALSLPLAAEAATISTTSMNSNMFMISSGNEYGVTYETLGNTYAINTISFTLNSTDETAAADMPLVYVSVDGQKTGYNEWDITVFGGNTVGYLFLDGFTTSSDFTVSIDYASGGSSTLMATYGFTASETTLPAVPVPAAGVLLVSALAGLGFAKRRGKKA